MQSMISIRASVAEWATTTEAMLVSRRNAFLHAVEHGRVLETQCQKNKWQAAIDGVFDTCASAEIAVSCTGAAVRYFEEGCDVESSLARFGVHDAAALIRDASSEISALCVEKYGIAPEVGIYGTGMMNVPPNILKFVLQELLKNSFSATIEKFGPLAIEDAPDSEVRVHLDACTSNRAQIRRMSIIDNGTGMLEDEMGVAIGWMGTTHVAGSQTIIIVVNLV